MVALNMKTHQAACGGGRGEEPGLFRQSWSRISASPPCTPAQGELWEGESEPGLVPRAMCPLQGKRPLR